MPSVSAAATQESSSIISGYCQQRSVSDGASFAQALAGAGENPAASGASERIAEFERWQRSYLTRGISEDHRRDVEASADTYRRVLGKAAAQGGYDDPQAFLQGLTKAELAAVQHIHCLADPIDPTGLDKEGALNLLYAPDQTRDIDRDGFQSVGKAKTWRFPPPDAPASVKRAWDAATAGMGEKDTLLLQGAFLGLTLPAATGQGSAYLGANADYAGLTRGILDAARREAVLAPAWQQASRAVEIGGLERFLAHLA
ncbi:hypothetical protein NNJEOMEG_01183 [Fundidesulfovibrio magnetotacticus]|uniref:Uncharacterized protein n=1 Tax=Fundidesulfovibrio magnetotacticus TaxID=2730080 RepID=A0A6V8LS15_9BACT|nr:hypothetical protein [Fundidesulfovibrio magnetotacticus]GFK93351.1 hypothetical protein NNJEOMEG_01183 [Fundidesulfovibrio magnetotacticus]